MGALVSHFRTCDVRTKARPESGQKAERGLWRPRIAFRVRGPRMHRKVPLSRRSLFHWRPIPNACHPCARQRSLLAWCPPIMPTGDRPNHAIAWGTRAKGRWFASIMHPRRRCFASAMANGGRRVSRRLYFTTATLWTEATAMVPPAPYGARGPAVPAAARSLADVRGGHALTCA